MRRVLDTLSVCDAEVQVKDGAWFLMRIQPYRTVENRVDGVVVTFVDVSERKQAEDAVRRSEARLKSFIDQARAGVAETDLQGRYLFVNEWLSMTLGFRRDELLRRTFADLADPADAASFGAARDALSSDSQTESNLDRIYVRKDGSRLHLHDRLSFIRDGAGQSHLVAGPDHRPVGTARRHGRPLSLPCRTSLIARKRRPGRRLVLVTMRRAADGPSRSETPRRVTCGRAVVRPARPLDAEAAERLLHELGVHQVELELQNEQLRQTHAALERSRDRYVALFEEAPVGYVTLGLNGTIIEANFQAGHMLSVPRSRLAARRFTEFVPLEDRAALPRAFPADAARLRHAVVRRARGDGDRRRAMDRVADEPDHGSGNRHPSLSRGARGHRCPRAHARGGVPAGRDRGFVRGRDREPRPGGPCHLLERRGTAPVRLRGRRNDRHVAASAGATRATGRGRRAAAPAARRPDRRTPRD